MDVGYIRKVAARKQGEQAFAELTTEPRDVLDDVLLHKAASAEDPELFQMAMTMPGDPIGNYEVMGGTFKKEAIGAPMFQASAAPDPVPQMASIAAPSATPSGPKAPSVSSGPQGGGGSQNPGKIQSIQEPKIPGASSQSSGGGMG